MNIDFSKGIHTSTEPINTPEGFYRDAENIRVSGLSKKSEEGNIRMPIPEQLVQWGNCSIGDETIIIGHIEGRGSIIGALTKDDSWTTLVDRGQPDILQITEPTQLEGRKNWKGDRLIYFATPGGARRINLDEYNYLWGNEDFDKNTTLFLEYDLPVTSYVSENHNGALLSGSYQASARLVTDSGAETVFGITSNVVPVVQDSLLGNRADVNGDPPQTPTTKALVFRINNIDTSFKYIEVGILTYVGLNNSEKAIIMNKILINGRTSIEVTYRGASDDAEAIDVTELITSGIFYETGKYLAQKDGTLLIGSPTEAKLPPIDWFRVAQNITAKYTVKKIKYDENLNFEYNYDIDTALDTPNIKETSATQMDQGYKNPLTCALYKGYRRGESYGFTLTPVFKTGVYGPTVHIPAMHSTDTEATKEVAAVIPTSANIVNLTPGSVDNWGIKAVNSAGIRSSISSRISVKLVGGPSAPTGLAAIHVTTTGFRLVWGPSTADPGTYVAKYIIMWDGNILHTLEGTPPQNYFNVTTVVPTQGYYYVIPVDSNGVHGTASDTIFVDQTGAGVPTIAGVVTPLAIVEPPTNLIASSIETTRFTLNWTASVTPDVVSYEIYRGNILHTTVHMTSGAGTMGNLGTFISDEMYTDDRYPDIPIGSGLRLHKFPDAITQPLLEGNVEENNQYIRVLGVEFSNIGLTSEELQYSDQIAGIIIGRLDRRGNETQLAQGLARPICDVRYDDNDKYTRSILLGDGTIEWESVMPDSKLVCKSIVPGPTDSIQFIAPDIIHGLYDPNSANKIYQHSLYQSNPNTINSNSFTSMSGRDDPSRPHPFFKNITGVSNNATALNTTKIQLEGSKVRSGPFGVPLMNGAAGGKINTTVINGSDQVSMASSDGFTWIKGLNKTIIPNHTVEQTGSYPIEHSLEYKRSSTSNHDNILSGSNTKTDFVLYSLFRDNPKQYGPLDQMISMFAFYQPWESFTGSMQFFNGDTFINKYGLTLNDEVYYPYTNDDDQDQPYQYIGFFKPQNASQVVYMWTESDNNYDYRHYIQPSSFNEGSIASTVGSVPFFPAYRQLTNIKAPAGILSMHDDNWVRPGYASQYNNQYSAQPNLKPYPVIPKEDVDEKASLVNRILYSAQVVQGEKLDSYQIFLPNNYYDVPQEFGELTDVYVNRELFASTNQVQWKLFFNTLATQPTSAGEVVLGTGGAFNRPAVPMQTVDGGFGGNSHWLHAENTIYGRVFVDKLQGRVFLLTDILSDISLTLKDSDRLKVQHIENLDILVGSEPLYDRAIIRLGNNVYSYHLLNKAFISRHTWSPRWMFSHSSYLYSNSTKYWDKQESSKDGILIRGIFKHGVGITGVFYGVRQDSTITMIVNGSNKVSKLFKSLALYTKMENESGKTLPFNTFTEMQIWNDERNSGLIKLTPKANAFQAPRIMEVLVSKVRDTFRLLIPRDVVVDPEIDIWNESNHIQKPGDTVPAKWLPKMRGNFIEIKLITDNREGPIYMYRADIEVSENIR